MGDPSTHTAAGKLGLCGVTSTHASHLRVNARTNQLHVNSHTNHLRVNQLQTPHTAKLAAVLLAGVLTGAFLAALCVIAGGFVLPGTVARQPWICERGFALREQNGTHAPIFVCQKWR